MGAWSCDSCEGRAIGKPMQDGVVVQVGERDRERPAYFHMHGRVGGSEHVLLAQGAWTFESIWLHFIEKQMGSVVLRGRGRIPSGEEGD
jgi:hypothetical protein